MEVFVAIDALDDLIHNAPRTPLSDDARINREKLLAGVARVRAGLQAAVGQPSLTRTGRLLGELEQLAERARPVRLVGGVRLDTERAFALIDGMRAAIADDVATDRGHDRPGPGSAVDAVLVALEDLLANARPVPLSDEVRLDPAALGAALATLRQVTAAQVPPPLDGPALAVVAVMDELAAGAKKIPLADEVRVNRELFREHIGRFRAWHLRS
jgi:hypothetical protein